MSDCRFGVSPVNYPDPDPDTLNDLEVLLTLKNHSTTCLTDLVF